jgi:hypothetical protein
MSRSKKKVAATSSDTITFKKSELIQKLEKFLDDEGACSGDWVNKVKVQLLGMEQTTFDVEVSIPITFTLDLPVDGVPTNDEITAYIKGEVDKGEWTEFDYLEANEDFVVKSVKRASKK